MAYGPHGVGAASTGKDQLGQVASTKTAKLYKVWLLDQTGSWGKSIVKVNAEGLRIEAATGSILVARAPNWEVVVFRKGQKKAAKISYVKFVNKVSHSIRAESFRGMRRKVQIAGIPAMQYVMPVNRRVEASEGFGHAYRSKLDTPFVKDMVMATADDSIALPVQVREIWRQYFEFSFIEKIPLEYYSELADGTKRYQFKTISQKYVNLPDSEFDHPKDLAYTAEFMQMVYGQKIEDVADLLMDP